jgi:hypothetical protein
MTKAELLRRLRKLEEQLAPAVLLPGIDLEWQALAAENPEARRRAEALCEWQRGQPVVPLMPDWDTDPDAFRDWLWLQSARAGGLAEFIALAWSPEPA